jgi:protein-disulfide isomerase
MILLRAPILTLLLFLATGCTPQADAGADNTERSETVETSGTTAPEGESPAEPIVAQAAGNAPATDRYPGLLFELLDATERSRYVGLAEAELCPCEGPMQSLDACLRTEDTCELGLQAGALMMRFVKERAGDVEVTDGIQVFVQNARRAWEFDLSNTACVGPEDAAITLVNFSDFECPHCAEFSLALHSVLETHPDAVRVCFKQYPLLTHQNATSAAVASIAAHQQGRFVEYHDLVFAHQTALSAAEDPTALLMSLANDAGLNQERFVADIGADSARAQVEADRNEGGEAGITSTPTCFFNGIKMLNGYTEEALRARVIEALAE